MVRYQAASGNAAARLATRDKHFILFDSPADKGAELKSATTQDCLRREILKYKF